MRRVYLPYGEDEAQQAMSAAQRQRLIERHRYSFAEHGYAPESLYWGSREEQEIYFETLTEIGIIAGDSLLDVGCGFADLDSWLKARNLPVDYTGIDISPDILEKGIEGNPELNLRQGEIFDFDWQPQSFDWVLLSGTLNWDLGDNGAYALRVIEAMFRLCSKGVAFNMLDKRHIDETALAALFAYNPQEILNFCTEITPYCQLRDDYHDHDFTIYMRRSEG